MQTNILISTLKAFNANYTNHYATQLYNEYPFKNSMYGLKKMLENYDITMYGIKFNDKDTAELTFPCVLVIGGQFVVATDYQDGQITYDYYGNMNTIPIEKFNGVWTGEALVCEEVPSKIVEKNYHKNRIQEVISIFSNVLPIILPLLIAGIVFLHRSVTGSMTEYIDLLINLFGLTICYFLIEKQIKGASEFGDRLCSFFHKVSCNFILDDEKSKFFGYSWSEIGMGYFMTRLVCWSFLPMLELPCSILNWCAIPFSIWCISYQFRKNMICTLCMFVQASIWCTAILHVFYYATSTEALHFDLYLVILCVSMYILGVIIVNRIISSIVLDAKLQNSISLARSIKGDKDVFDFILQKQFKVEVPDIKKYTQYGNSEAKYIVTVLTNPYCSHCADMHERIEKVLQTIGDKIAIQYIFEAFLEDQKRACKLLIASHQQLNREDDHKLLDTWFHKKDRNIDSYIGKYHLDLERKDVDETLNYYHHWRLSTQLTATPTLFVNGYLLPKEFEVEDLLYIL